MEILKANNICHNRYLLQNKSRLAKVNASRYGYQWCQHARAIINIENKT